MVLESWAKDETGAFLARCSGRTTRWRQSPASEGRSPAKVWTWFTLMASKEPSAREVWQVLSQEFYSRWGTGARVLFSSGRSALRGPGCGQTQMGCLQQLRSGPPFHHPSFPGRGRVYRLGSLCPGALCRDQPQLLGYESCRRLSREGILSRCGSQPWPLPPSHLGSSKNSHRGGQGWIQRFRVSWPEASLGGGALRRPGPPTALLRSAHSLGELVLAAPGKRGGGACRRAGQPRNAYPGGLAVPFCCAASLQTSGEAARMVAA